MIKQLVLVAVGAMLVLNVSAKEVKKGKCRSQSFRKEQRVIFLRPGQPVPRAVRFAQARRMRGFEAVRFEGPRREAFRPGDSRKGPHRHHRHHVRR